MWLEGGTKTASVVMEETRSNDWPPGLELGKREGTSKRDSEEAATEIEGNSRRNSVLEAMVRKVFQGGGRVIMSNAAYRTCKMKMEQWPLDLTSSFGC